MGNPKYMLFMGNGDRSLAECYRLHLKLDRAINTLGGIQQGGCSESERSQAEFEIDETAKTIYFALTGETPWLKETPKSKKRKKTKASNNA
jgi:hypothetical protein